MQLTESFNGRFHEWIINKNDYVYQENSSAFIDRLHQGLILLSHWSWCKKGVCYVFSRWISDANKSGYSKHVFDSALAQNIIDTQNIPSTHLITLKSGERCEVLSELNEKILYGQLSPWNFREAFPSYRPHLILTSMPYLSSLSLIVESPLRINFARRQQLFELVPHLRSLKISPLEELEWEELDNQDYGLKNEGKLNIRQTMKCLPHLESLTLSQLYLTIQDMIDIACQPNLSFISLDGIYDMADSEWFDYENGENIYNVLFDGFNPSSPSASPLKTEIKNDENINDEREEEEEAAESEDDDEAADDSSDNNNIDSNEDENNKFRVIGDKGVKFSKHCKQIIPAQMNKDLLYINDLLSNSASSIASVRARLGLVNDLKSELDGPNRGTSKRPLRYLWHIRHQLSIIHQSLTKSIDKNNINDTMNDAGQPNKKRRLI